MLALIHPDNSVAHVAIVPPYHEPRATRHAPRTTCRSPLSLWSQCSPSSHARRSIYSASTFTTATTLPWHNEARSSRRRCQPPSWRARYACFQLGVLVALSTSRAAKPSIGPREAKHNYPGKAKHKAKWWSRHTSIGSLTRARHPCTRVRRGRVQLRAIRVGSRTRAANTQPLEAGSTLARRLAAGPRWAVWCLQVTRLAC